MPDSSGVLRVARAVTTEENEEFTFEVVDPKRMLNIFGGKLSGFVSGTCILYIPDPEDASGKCSLISESFSCRVTRDGGLSFGKAVALSRGLPLVAVNHLEGHAVSARLTADIPYPFLLLLVSGGHCQLLAVEGIGACRRLGRRPR